MSPQFGAGYVRNRILRWTQAKCACIRLTLNQFPVGSQSTFPPKFEGRSHVSEAHLSLALKSIDHSCFPEIQPGIGQIS